MKDLSQTPTKVVWSEGMLISPQHLQQQEHYFESAMAHRFSAMTPYYWGVRRIELDAVAITQGEVRLLGLEAVMPDGLAMSMGPGSANPPETRQLADQFKASDGSLNLYVGIPVERAGVSNFDSINGSGPSASESRRRIRYHVETRELYDLTRDRSSLSVQVATPRAQLLFEHEDRSDFVCLKIAEVTRNDQGNFGYRKEFVPPALMLGASVWLQSRVRDTLALAVQRHRSLLERRRQRDESKLEIATRDIDLYLLMTTIAGQIPGLAHYASQDNLSPHALYLHLIQLAGQLSALSIDVDPNNIPAYTHADLRKTFEPLFDMLHQLLGSRVDDGFIRIPLEARSDGMWLGRLKDERLAKCSRYILAIETDIPAEDVASRLPTLAKIANFSQIADLVRNAVQGAEVRSIHRPPDAIPIRPRHVYFEFTGRDRYWRDILGEKSFAFYVGQPFDQSRITVHLMAILDK